MVGSDLIAAPGASLVEAPGAIVDGPQRDLLCALSHVYLACGESNRALSLLRLVDAERPDDVEVIRALAYAHIAVGEGESALAQLDRLDGLDLDAASRTPLLLMRSHALRLLGRWLEARSCFAQFVIARQERV
jgi:Flp pilus assembly protein TadD